MVIEGTKRANLDVHKEVSKPPVEVKKPEPATVDNRNSVVGVRNYEGDMRRAALNARYDGGLTAKGGLPGTGAATMAKIFGDDAKGVAAGGNQVTPYDPNAKPEEAAAFIKYDPAFNAPESKTQAFADALELHKDDPEWQKNFLAAVGTEDAASYIDGIYNLSNKDVIDRYSATVRTTLENLIGSGDFDADDMNKLVGELKNAQPYVFEEIFGKSTNDGLREMFVRSAAANGNERLAAAASDVLAGMSKDKQAALLTELDRTGKLDSFIQKAMAGQVEVVELGYKVENPNAGFADAPKTTLGGVEQILRNAGIQSGYNGSTFETAPYSQDLQQKLFYAAAKGLTNPTAASNFESNVAFKDALSTVFLQHFDEIFKNSISPNASSLNGDTEWLGAFFENTMFAQPPSTKAADVLATVYSKVAGLAKATDLIRSGKQPLTAEEQKLVDDYNTSSPRGAGWETGQAAGVIGEWLGNFDRAYQNAVGKIKNDAAGNKALLDLFIGTVDKLTGLAKLEPGASIAKDLLVDQLKTLPGYVEGKQVESGKAKIEDSAKLITDLNNLIWDTIYSDNKDEYSQSFDFVAGHSPRESGLK